MFGFGKKKVVDQSSALEIAQILATSRGRMLFLPAANGESGGHSVWSGLITFISDKGTHRVVHAMSEDGFHTLFETSLTREEITASVFGLQTAIAPAEAPAPVPAALSGSDGVSASWKAHAYPLQQLTIRVQGQRTTEKASILSQVSIALDRLASGELAGSVHDDDFGYWFSFVPAAPGPSFFDTPAGSC